MIPMIRRNGIPLFQNGLPTTSYISEFYNTNTNKMKPSASILNTIVWTICYLYALLFIYAAVSKILDFENFRVQLGQSPLLSAFAAWLSWAVPISEIIFAILVLNERTRAIGLFFCFLLMIMFSSYIYIILNYSESIPCSCGGILEKMGWIEHLWFNIGFLVLAVIGILLSNNKDNSHEN